MDKPEHGLERADGFTRAELVKAAAAGAIGLGFLGGGYLLWGEEETAAPLPTTTPREPVQRFVSRPDLRPPAITVLRGADDTADGLLFLTPASGPGQRGALMLDDAGQVVWFRPSTPFTTMDFRPGVYKGEPVLTWWEGRQEEGVGLRGSYVIADTSYREITRFRSRDDVRPDFHEYFLTERDTAIVVSYDGADADLSSVGARKDGRVYEGVIQELEIPSGRVLFNWRSLEHVGVDESYQTQVARPYDYFHINSVDFDSDGHLLVSARNTWAVYKIHRETGEVIWRLGGKKSDFQMDKGTRFAFQHDARSHDDGRLISIFDNGVRRKKNARSRAIVLQLDTDEMRATLDREIVHDPPVFARVTGNAQLLPDDNMLVCWGSSGYFTEYGGDDERRFDAKLPKGGINYRVYRLPWTGRPTDRPRLASNRGTDGAAKLYASWNGATDLASWRLRTGSSAGSLEDGPTSDRTGFETELAVPEGAAYAAAVALDEDGDALGESNVVRL